MRSELLSAARAALRVAGSAGRAAAFWVPGRIEVLGKHTDYAGRTQPDLRGRARLRDRRRRPRADSPVRVHQRGRAQRGAAGPRPALPDPPDAWVRYPATVLRRVARNFPDARRGADVAFLERPAAGVGHEQFQRVHGGRVPGRGRRERPGAGRAGTARRSRRRGPGRVPGHRRERTELRRADRRPRRGHVRRQRGPHGHAVLPRRRAERLLVLPGAARAPGAVPDGSSVRRGGERREGREDRALRRTPTTGRRSPSRAILDAWRARVGTSGRVAGRGRGPRRGRRRFAR